MTISCGGVRFWALVSLSGWLVASQSGCRTIPKEPPNLTAAKEAAIAYQVSGDYDEAVAAIAREAEDWIERRVAARAPDERLAVVFDIDETVLSNFPHMLSQDFGYHPAGWAEWVRSAEAPALAPTRLVYRRARELGVAVVFITGRSLERDAEDTARNLEARGMGDHERLVLMPADARGLSTEAWKTSVRSGLVADGWVIVANIGDQWSDLRGGHAERVFKIPNPFYRID